MTPENLEKAHTLLNRYRYLQNVAENFSICTGYRVMLRMEFKGREDGLRGTDHSPDLPVDRNWVNGVLNMLLDEVDQQLKDLGVEV
jgi:hypothetical protein